LEATEAITQVRLIELADRQPAPSATE
jgi:hypothetical protein